MKATINGIVVEGTPQEIVEYQRVQVESASQKQLFKPVDNPWFPNGHKPVITCGLGRRTGPASATQGEVSGVGSLNGNGNIFAYNGPVSPAIYAKYHAKYEELMERAMKGATLYHDASNPALY